MRCDPGSVGKSIYSQRNLVISLSASYKCNTMNAEGSSSTFMQNASSIRIYQDKHGQQRSIDVPVLQTGAQDRTDKKNDVLLTMTAFSKACIRDLQLT